MRSKIIVLDHIQRKARGMLGRMDVRSGECEGWEGAGWRRGGERAVERPKRRVGRMNCGMLA